MTQKHFSLLVITTGMQIGCNYSALYQVPASTIFRNLQETASQLKRSERFNCEAVSSMVRSSPEESAKKSRNTFFKIPV